jgi:hypothetical protein
MREKMSDDELRKRVDAAPRSIEPPTDLWPGIRAAIASRATRRVVPLPPPGDAATPHAEHARRRPWRWLVAAALILVAGTTLIVVRHPQAERDGRVARTGDSSAAGGLSGSTTVSSVAPAAALGDTGDHVAEDLLAELELRRSALRPSASAEVDANLRVIDLAIAEVQAALARDPNNLVLRRLLAEARSRKAELLKQIGKAS